MAENQSRAFSGKVESGFASANATKQRVRAFRRFRETVKCSRALLPEKWNPVFGYEARPKEKGNTSHIHERAYRNTLLTPERMAANTDRSRVRVEHIFGHIETATRGRYVRTRGMAKGSRSGENKPKT
jgi:hypothetical protein